MKSHARPPSLQPHVEILPTQCDRQFEQGYRFLSEKFAEQEAELERLRKVVYDKDRNSLDTGIGKG